MKNANVHSLGARKKTLQRPQGNETRKTKETERYERRKSADTVGKTTSGEEITIQLMRSNAGNA